MRKCARMTSWKIRVNPKPMKENILNNPKILVLVLAIDKDPWKKIETYGQELTWREQPPENIQILRYIGIPSYPPNWNLLNAIWRINYKVTKMFKTKKTFLSINRMTSNLKAARWHISRDNREIQTGIPELYSLIGHKTIQAFKACIEEFDFDYIYRTNVSSYLKLEKMNLHIKDQPRFNYYAGFKGSHHDIAFASGSGYFISRDLVEKVISLESFWDHNLIDDVAIGKLLACHLDVHVSEIARLDLDSVGRQSVRQISKNQHIFHFRCKTKNANVTINLMHILHSIKP